MFKLFKRKGSGCSHKPISKYDRWEHSASGHGYWVSECRLCGAEMTQSGGGNWQAVAVKDRP